MDMQSAVIARLPVPEELESFNVVKNLVTSALLECCSIEEFETLKQTDVIERVAEQAHDDLLAFASKDPAAGRDLVFIARTYTSYSAVLHYRLAHWVYRHGASVYGAGGQCLAAMISRRGKMLSGAEIHFRSRIGARFIIDHGMGTVIGETATIGDDCYVLGGVTLGARGISGNPSSPRHPTLGDRVQIGAFASVLGAIHIGDGAFIGPGCIVTKDVPAAARVQVKTSLQVVLES
ncbi:serine O-acetyltransferase [Pseudomonas sp. NY5710]|uniref:serine O-acetyltransferase n=1 Tax=Pseudomonas TaxID=286 RepID=UPI00156DF32D|nr:serine O-acetyltransferase [Pseudomonas sp. NY5710]QKL03419.1 serine acetyltransferase [Pseudomonas sp. NY5710]